MPHTSASRGSWVYVGDGGVGDGGVGSSSERIANGFGDEK